MINKRFAPNTGPHQAKAGSRVYNETPWMLLPRGHGNSTAGTCRIVGEKADINDFFLDSVSSFPSFREPITRDKLYGTVDHSLAQNLRQLRRDMEQE